jgi:hypothetical protein
LRKGIENALVEGASIHNTEIEIELLIGGNLQPRWLSVSAEPIELDDRQYVVVAIDDITKRKQRAHELEVIAALSDALRAAAGRNAMLPVIVNQIAGLLNSDSVVIEIIKPFTGESVVEAVHGVGNPRIGARQKKRKGITAAISQTLKPYHTNNFRTYAVRLFFALPGGF